MGRACAALVTMSLVTSLVTCGVAGAAGDGAHLEVSGTRSLAIGTFADGARINTNRDYAFQRVPETLKGMNYTSHEHKAPATVSINVKRAGKLYVCLTEGATLSRCGIDGGWKDAGELQGSDAGKTNGWKVYRGDVKAGSTLTLSSPNKWGVVVAAGKIEGAPAVKSAPAGPGEYSQIEKQLRERKPGDGNYRKRMDLLAEQTHRQESLLKDSDRDPLDVVLRRTEALVKNLTSGKMKVAAALRRPPSKLKPDVDGSYPLLFPRLLQGLIDKKCVDCHTKEKRAPDLSSKTGRNGWTKSFETLHRYGFARHGGNGAIRKNEGSISIAGKVGMMGSKFLRVMREKHKDRVKLTPEELYRFTLWIDCNTCFYGAYFETEKQAKGEVVMPKLE